MTQSKNASLTQLTEVFPTWPQEDLLTVLNEAGGDVYVAISRISEGHVSQWSDSTKKAASAMSTFESSRPMRTDRNRENRNNNNLSSNGRTERDRNQRPVAREQRERPQYTENRKPLTKSSAPVSSKPVPVKTPQTELSWGNESALDSVATAPASMVSAAAVAEPKTSFAEAAASALAEKPKKEKKQKEVPAVIVDTVAKIEPETIKESKFVEVTPVETVTEPIIAEVETVLVPEVEIKAEVEVPPVAVQESSEDEEIVSMPARATPSLTMEQPAVVLPVRTNLRTNLCVRFGYDSSVEEGEKSSSVAVEETVIQPVKTPITVSALESTFAMLSTSPAPAVKSPEPILSPPSPEASAWENARNPSGTSSSGYESFSRNRQHGGWDYEPTSPATAGAPVATQGGSFGPAPGFGGPTSSAAPQRFVSRAAAQYEHPGVYSPSAVPSTTAGNSNNSRFSPYDESNSSGNNNVSQYYTTRTGPQSTSGYPVYRGNNSFNASRYSSPNRPYYQQHPHHQSAPAAAQQSASSGHYSPYSPHQNYLNNYHHGYPQYHQHADQYSNQQQQQQPQQQPYYQPYQPPTQYLSNSNMHHHTHHHQNQHHNA